MNKGFTLVELLVVIILIATIALIGTYGITGAQRQINKDMWDAEEQMIINRAKVFGEDNKNHIEESVCNDYKGTRKDKCLKIYVQTLIDRKYYSTKEKDKCDQKVVVNELYDQEGCLMDTSCYYINNWPIYIYIENNSVYAEMPEPSYC